MKIVFTDKSFVECQKSSNPGKIILTIGARDQDDPLKKTTNTVELTVEQFKNLTSEL